MAHLVLYDGICGLCNRSVNFILRHDRREQFLFAPMQSQTGYRLLQKLGYSSDELETFVLLENFDSDARIVLTRSDAALFVMRELGGWCRLWGVARLLPRAIRDWGYRLIARNRYSWFGKYDACPLPEERYRHRFIDQ